jgi:metal-responsive CopG/Arc/MetJ family transcriptional regulator
VDKLLTMNIDETFLREVDAYWQRFGFKSRSDFIRFSCSQLMEKYKDENVVTVEKSYFEWMNKSLKEKLATNVAATFIDTDAIKKELFEMVYQNTLKKLINAGEINE